MPVRWEDLTPVTPAKPVRDPGLEAHLREYPDEPTAPSWNDLVPVKTASPPVKATARALFNAPFGLTAQGGAVNPLGDFLTNLAYNFTIGPFEQAGQVLRGSTPAEREQVMSAMSPDERAAYLESGRGSMTPLAAMLDTSGKYSDVEKTALMGPLTGLGLLGALGSQSVGGVPYGPGKGIFRYFQGAQEIPVPPPPRPMKALPPAPPYETLIGDLDALPRAERARLLNLAQPEGVPSSKVPPGPQANGPTPIFEGVSPYQTEEQALQQARAVAEGRLPVPPSPQRTARQVKTALKNEPPPVETQPVVTPRPPRPAPSGTPEAQPTLPVAETPVAPEVTMRMRGLRNTIKDARTSVPTGKQFYRDQDGNIVKTGNAGPLLPRFYEMFHELRDLPPDISPKELVDAIDRDKGNKVYRLLQEATAKRIAIEDAQDYQRFSNAWDEVVNAPDPLMQRVDASTSAATQAEQAYTAAQRPVVTGETGPRLAPVEYAGYQEGFGKVPGFHQYTLTEDLSPQLVKGSTVSAAKLRQAGYEVPPPPPTRTSEAGAATPSVKQPWEMSDAEIKAYTAINENREYPTFLDFPKTGKEILSDYDKYGRIGAERKWAVESALRNNRPIPPEVLAEYPDLVRQVKPPTPTQPPLLTTQATMPHEGLQPKAPQVEHGDLLEGMKPQEPTRQAGLPLKTSEPPWVEEFRSIGGHVNPDGTVVLWHATTKDKAARIVKEGILRRPQDAPDSYGVYFSSSKDVAHDYGDGTLIPVRVKVADLSPDDVFPGSRMDFSAKTQKGIYKPVAVGDAALMKTPEQTVEIGMGLPIPPKVKEWAKRNISAFTKAAAGASRPVPPEGMSAIDRAAFAEQRLRDLRQQLAQPKPPSPPAGGATRNMSGGSATASMVSPQPPVTDINALPRYYNTTLANQNRTRPLLSGGYHGMNQIAEAAPQAARAFRRAANAEHTWSYAVTEAKDLINQQGGAGAFDRFTKVMAQSQQEGNVRRWTDLARQLRDADPYDVPDLYRERVGDALSSIGEQPAAIGAHLMDRWKAATTDTGKLNNAVKLQQHLVQSFEDASQHVTRILDEPTYRAQLQSPAFQRALATWKQTIGNDLTAAHIQNNGHVLRPEYLGDTGQYFPMVGKAASEQAALGLRSPRPAGPYSKPGNPANKRRGGLSPDYDLSLEAIQGKIGSTGWAADHAKAIAQAEADGLIRRVSPGTPAKDVPRTYDYNGVTYKAERVGDHVMPSWVRDEIGPIFERFRAPSPPTGLVGSVARKIVGLNTKLGVDKFFHYVNETGLLGAQAPTIGRTQVGRTLGSLPGVKTAHAFTTLFNRLTTAERPVVREMLRNGEWYPRFNDSGELTNMARRDLAGRLTFRQAIQRWKPNATPQELYDASTRFGEYNPQLASNAVRAIKQSPVFSSLAPFVTAGNAFVRNALGTLTMQGPGGAAARLTAAATGGIPAALGTWVAVHLGMTGHVPDPSDQDFKFLQVPYGTTPEGRTKYLNVGRAVSPLFNRGARSAGLTGALETMARGGTSQQAFESALSDMVNAQVHPYTGPVVKVGARLVAGIDPQIQFQGGGMSLRRAHPPTETLPGHLTANVRSSLEAANPALERLAKPIERVVGVQGGRDAMEGLSAVEQAAQAIGLVSVSDNQQRARMLRWSDRQTQRAARRAQR